jgi:hypothetical protein
MKQAFLTGYTGRPTRTPEQLRQLAINLDAVVVDSRYSPYSRVPHWDGIALRHALGNARYMWIMALGNRTYKRGAITLDNPAYGLDRLNNHTANNFIILCACADGETCHRKQVGEYLAVHGWTVREVTQAEWEAAR